MRDTNIRDIKIFLFIVVVGIFLLAIGWTVGTGSASGVACRNLGYESGYLTSYFADARVVCESSNEMPIPDMWMAP